MRLKTLTTGLLIGLLAGCSDGTSPYTTVTSTSESPQASKSKVTETNEFDNYTKAAQNNLRTPKEIGRAALLNEQQIEQLLQLEPSDEVVEGEYKYDIGKVKALVPTYVPPGFRLDSMTIKRYDNKLPEYKLEYKNNSGKCYRLFSILGSGDGPLATVYKQIKNPILGDIAVGYTTSDFSGQGKTMISFVNPIFRTYKGKYTGYIFDSGNSPNQNTTCEAVSMEESIKIINSIVELDPSKPFDPEK